MNLPNKLTVARAVLTPVFMAVMLVSCIPFRFTAALLIFIVASYTDHLDGKLARKYQLVTNFGKFMDPLADKLLVCSALICLVALERIPAWIVIIIIAREFVISGIRLIAADDGVVIAASQWGKIKTTFQMIMVGFMIGNLPIFDLVTATLMWIALALTLISLVDYIAKNINIFRTFGE